MSKVRDHVPLRDICRFRTGGTAEYLVEVTTLAELIDAVTTSVEANVPFRVIGQASRVLISDSGFPGMIILNRTHGSVFVHDRSQIIVDAGVSLAHLLNTCLSHGYSGVEFLTNHEGTVGGAIYSNRIMSDHHISASVKSATLLFPEHIHNPERATQRVDRAWFGFQPYTSRLKQQRLEDHYGPVPIILSVTLQLSRMNHATCLHKLQEFRRQQLPLPKDQAYLEVFDTLRLRQNLTEAESGRKANLYHLVTGDVLRHSKVNDIEIFAKNPNYIVNTRLGTSREADQVVAMLQNSLKTDQIDAPVPLYEKLGVWE